MKFGNRNLSLRTAIALFVSTVVVVSLLITGLLIGIHAAQKANQQEADKAMAVAIVVAHSPLVIEALEGKRSRTDVQTFTNGILNLTGVRFIVVMDMNHVRLSHPNPLMIGKKFVGGDEGPAMLGKTYTSVAKGTLGRSLRAFVPVKTPTGKQVGVVAVGIMLTRVQQMVANSERVIYLGIGIGLVVGIIGALILATKIKKVLFGLEPAEIGKLWQERNALLESVREGVLAVNTELEIIVANAEAIRMFRKGGVNHSLIGESLGNYFSSRLFLNVLNNGNSEYDAEYELGGIAFVVNIVPIQVNRETIGVVATFRDKTELQHMAEQLTGIKRYAEALRAQTHEFMNRLHVILSLIHREDYQRLSQYVDQISNKYHEEVGEISGLIRDPVFAGFILSKLSFARENGVILHISGRGILPEATDPDIVHDLITITGNLLDNSFDAIAEQHPKEIDIAMSYDEHRFTWEISDNGMGIPPSLQERIYERGFSTKGEHRGYGLFLVRRCVERLNGSLELQAVGQFPTRFKVCIPYPAKEDGND